MIRLGEKKQSTFGKSPIKGVSLFGLGENQDPLVQLEYISSLIFFSFFYTIIIPICRNITAPLFVHTVVLEYHILLNHGMEGTEVQSVSLEKK